LILIQQKILLKTTAKHFRTRSLRTVMKSDLKWVYFCCYYRASYKLYLATQNQRKSNYVIGDIGMPGSTLQNNE